MFSIHLKNCSLTLNLVCFTFRPMVPQLAPPKIPEGERVDFDVSHKHDIKPKHLCNKRQTSPRFHNFQHSLFHKLGCSSPSASRTHHPQDPVPFMQGGVMSRCRSGASASTAAVPQPRPPQSLYSFFNFPFYSHLNLSQVSIWNYFCFPHCPCIFLACNQIQSLWQTRASQGKNKFVNI